MNSIIHCTNINQLSDFIVHIILKIWNNNTNSTILILNNSNAFKFFCQNLIKATQISNSCILVALYYIYKLRFTYPTIKPSIGSEIRLFTTALILANKFLDDNTYTNRTWSEVSCVPLVELNIMEMEFLSALDYKTRINHVQFFSWVSQCQYWMYQLLNNRSILTNHQLLLRNKKKWATNNSYHPYRSQQQPARNMPMLSWSSSTNSFAQANSVATVAAATAAVNVNYSNFIPRVSPQQ